MMFRAACNFDSWISFTVRHATVWCCVQVAEVTRSRYVLRLHYMMTCPSTLTGSSTVSATGAPSPTCRCLTTGARKTSLGTHSCHCQRWCECYVDDPSLTGTTEPHNKLPNLLTYLLTYRIHTHTYVWRQLATSPVDINVVIPSPMRRLYSWYI